MISMKTKYALLALDALARSDKEAMLIADLASGENIPKKFLESILLTLRNQGVLNSKKGPGGGYSLARPAAAITIGSIVRAFEGDLAPVQCLSNSASGKCPECGDMGTCGIRLVMVDVNQALSSVLDGITLADMLERSDFAHQKRSQLVDYAI
jgi:Rrf2 family protein